MQSCQLNIFTKDILNHKTDDSVTTIAAISIHPMSSNSFREISICDFPDW